MLNLKPCIHLEKVKTLVFADDEFDRPRTLVVNGLGQSHGLLAHRLACRRIKEGRGSFFNHFLMTTLDRTFTLM